MHGLKFLQKIIVLLTTTGHPIWIGDYIQKYPVAKELVTIM